MELYDLYITQACDYLPEFSDLAQQTPVVTYEAFQQWIVTKKFGGLGFLHLQLEKSLAEQLLQRLKSAGARGAVFKAAYRQPKLTFEEAHRIAEQAILGQQKQHYPSHSFGPVV